MSWISLDEMTLHYELTGDGARTIVLLHELGGSLESFDGLMAALTPRFRVLRYDQRGAGLSEKPRRAFTVADQIADLRQLVAALGIAPPVHLAGVAAGSAIAIGYALDLPNRVASLGLCAPAVTVAADRVRYLTERSELAVRDGMAAIVEASLERSYPPIMRRDEATYLAYRARFIGNDPVGYAFANLALAGNRLDQRLGELTVRALVLAGAHDLLRPPNATAVLAKAIVGAQFAIIDSGHLMPVQAPDEMGRRLAEFFAGVDA